MIPKFRVWNPVDKSWFSAVEHYIDGDGHLQYFNMGHGSFIPTPHLEASLSTGLKDRNGVEIYEGDIVRYTFDPHYFPKDKPTVLVEEVKYQPEEAFAPIPGTKYNGGPDGTEECMDFEVIGNKWENPELLEE